MHDLDILKLFLIHILVRANSALSGAFTIPQANTLLACVTSHNTFAPTTNECAWARVWFETWSAVSFVHITLNTMLLKSSVGRSINSSHWHTYWQHIGESVRDASWEVETTFGDKKYDYCRLKFMVQRHLEQKMKDQSLNSRQGRALCKGKATGKGRSNAETISREDVVHVGLQKANARLEIRARSRMTRTSKAKGMDDLVHLLRQLHRTEIRNAMDKVVMTEAQKAHNHFMEKVCQWERTDYFVESSREETARRETHVIIGMFPNVQNSKLRVDADSGTNVHTNTQRNVLTKREIQRRLLPTFHRVMNDICNNGNSVGWDGAEVKLYPISAKDKRSSASVRRISVFPRKFKGYALNAEGTWTGGLLIVATEDLKTRPPSEFHEKSKSKDVDIFQKRDNEYDSMQDGRNIARMTAVILPLPTSGKNSSNNLQQKEKPEITDQILKFNKISGVFWEITHVGIMLLRWRSSRVPKDDIPIPFLRTIVRCLIYLDVQRQTKTSSDVFKMRPSMITGTWMETSHCLNRGSVWHDSRCSTKIYQKDICVFKADWRWNNSQQDKEPFGQRNRQTCRKAHSVQP